MPKRSQLLALRSFLFKSAGTTFLLTFAFGSSAATSNVERLSPLAKKTDHQLTLPQIADRPQERKQEMIDDTHVLLIRPQYAPKLVVKQKVVFIAVSRDLRSQQEVVMPVKWASTNTSVLSISKNGKAKAKRPGVAQVTATFGQIRAVLNVQVFQSVAEAEDVTTNSLRSDRPPDPSQTSQLAAAQLLDDELSTLLTTLSSLPTQAQIERAAELMSQVRAVGREAELEKVLRELLNSPKYRNFVLLSLSHFTIREFDPELALLLPPITTSSFGPDLDLILEAVARSGGQQSIERLEELAKLPFPASAAGPSPEQLSFRRQLWAAYFKLVPALATSHAVNFYNTPSGRFELDADAKAADQLIGFINTVSKDHDSLLRLLPNYDFFLGRDERVFGPAGLPPLNTGPPTSQRYRVCKAIEQSLLSISNPSPAILSVLLRFTQADDPSIGDPARAVDYKAMERAPWLLPAGSFVFMNADTDSKAWSVTKQLRIGLPRNSLFLPESKYEELRTYEKFAGPRGALVSSGDFSRSEADVNRELKNLVNSIFQYLGSSYDLNTSDTILSPQSFPTLDAELPYRYVSLNTTYFSLTEGLSVALQRLGQTNEEASKLSQVLVAKELERRSLVLYSILAARRRAQLNSQPLDISKLDEELDSLSSSIGDLPGVLRTQIVSEIVPMNAASLNTQFPSGCGSVSFNVISRNISFNQGLYEENLSVNCASGEKKDLRWVGPIPLTLVVALRRHPRLLDFPSISLAAREFKVEAKNAPPLMEDIDYVRSNPILAISYLATGLTSPNVPWSHIRDTIIVESNYGEPISFLAATAQPINTNRPPVAVQPVPSGISNVSGISIAPSDSAFESAATDIQKPYLDLLTYRTQRLIAERLKPYVENIDIYQPCHPFNPPCWLGIGNYPHVDEEKRIPRDGALNKIHKMIDESSANEKVRQEWDLSSLRNSKIRSVNLIAMVLKPNLSEFAAIYHVLTDNGVIRYMPVRGKLSPLPEIVLEAIRKDPNFLYRFNIDLPQMSEGAEARLVAALQRFYRKDAALAALNRTGFYPLNSPDFSVRPSLPLYRTIEGKIRSSELTVVSEIYDWALGEALPMNDVPKPHFIDAIGTQIETIAKQISDIVASNTQPTIDEIQRQKKVSNEFVIGVSVTFGAPVPIYTGTFSYGGVGVNFSTSFNGTITATGTINGQTLPLGFNLRFPRPDEKAEGFSTAYNRAAFDAALSYMPTRMAVAGTSYRVVNTMTDPRTAANLIVNTEIPSTWLRLPPLQNNWKLWTNRHSEGVWLSGLISRAEPRLTQSERDALLISIKAGAISDEMLSLLTAKYKEAVEADNIASRQWVRTTVVLDLLMPGGGTETLTEAERESLIEGFNQKSASEFLKDIAKAKALLKTNQISDGGLPAVTLTYGNNFTLMRWRYAYKLVNGAEISYERISETPYFLVEQIRQNPTGHVYEMIYAAAMESIITGIGLPNSLIARGEAKKFTDSRFYQDKLNEVLEPTGITIKDKLKTAIEEFFAELEKWVNSQPPGSTGATPFIPPVGGTPMLNFFPSPYEWSLRRDETVGQILTSQRQTPLASQIRSGEIVLRNPTPVVP
ncbi:MAG: hypothetical protein LC794_10130 [Acidobacteria bacterium]|nr:hypothetical protein [Acidobacteriota bacterium]